MDAVRATAASILALGLLAGSADALEARDETVASSAPSMFTWYVAGPPRPAEDPETGRPVVVVEIEATDERAAGLATSVEDVGRLVEDALGYFVLGAGTRLVNEGGSWVGAGRGVTSSELAGEGERYGGAGFTEYIGEGGYEGLTMYTFRIYGSEGQDSIGFIVPTDIAPAFPAPPGD